MTLPYRHRLLLLAVLAAAGGIAVLGRLFTLQVADHGRWAARAEAQVASWRPIHARRGRILDAEGRELAGDEAGFDLALCAAAWEGRLYACTWCGFHRYYRLGQTAGRCPRCRKSDTLAFADRRDIGPVARLLDAHPSDLMERIEQRVGQAHRAVQLVLDGYPEKLRAQRRDMLWADHGWRPRRIARDVPYEVVCEVELHPERNPAFRITTVHTRRSRGGRAFVHLLGTVRQRSVKLRDPDGGRERVQMPSGRDGLEARLEGELQGRWGWVKVLRDPRTGDVETLERRPPVHGRDVRLTVATADQVRAASVLAGATASLVVVNAETGAVLAAASAPDYEPEEYGRLFVQLSREHEAKGSWPRYHALRDTAFSDFNAPGSVVKPFTAVAGLVAGVATPETRILCEHHFTNRRGEAIQGFLTCNGTHGEQALHGALVHSCNIYFQTLQKEMIERELFPRFAETGARFGFGRPTGIEIEPADVSMSFRFGHGWASWIMCAIGQGEVMLSPAQVARAYAGLATGALPRLHLVAEVGGEPTRVERTPLGVPESVLAPVRAALAEVPRHGTAKGYGLEQWGLACKTGTAQRGGRHNAWMAGFAPARGGRPPVAFAMAIFDTPRHGSEACGPRLAEFFRGFYGESRE